MQVRHVLWSLTSSKCDQLKPSCSRCTRLQIPCTGAGQQRYKFKQVRVSPDEAGSYRSQPATSTALSRTPSNEASRLLSELIQKLEVKEVRYDLCWGYGYFLRDVPKRLGTNAALDSAVRALMAMSSYLCTAQQQSQQPLSLARYGHALNCLRTCLDDPATARSSSTLCAIMLIWICHVRLPRISKSRSF